MKGVHGGRHLSSLRDWGMGASSFMLRGGVQVLEKDVSHRKIDNRLPSLLRNLQKVQREENGFTLAFFKQLKKGKVGHAWLPFQFILLVCAAP